MVRTSKFRRGVGLKTLSRWLILGTLAIVLCPLLPAIGLMHLCAWATGDGQPTPSHTSSQAG